MNQFLPTDDNKISVFFKRVGSVFKIYALLYHILLTLSCCDQYLDNLPHFEILYD